MRHFRTILKLLAWLAILAAPSFGQSVARQWNEVTLDAIRRDFPAPTVHARNLHQLSMAMWDAWAAYDKTAVGFLHNESATAADIEAARAEAISYAAYRILGRQYGIAVGASASLSDFATLMENLGYATTNFSTTGPTPAAVGNRVATSIALATMNDGSNQDGLYADNSNYFPSNQPLILANRGTSINLPNRWQPLAFNVAFTQNGQVASNIQLFVGPHWGEVIPFALQRSNATDLYLDPGLPPQIGGTGDAEFKAGNLEVIRYSSLLDPTALAMIDISPGAMGNNPLGLNSGTGHPLNPATTAPYASNVVNHADFGRCMAEFWADGPDSETPPGHWNTLANEVADTTGFVKRVGGTGPVVNDLEWDVKVYMALNGALHDAAIAAWQVKAHYDYVRPISSIRYLGGQGQSSDPAQPNFTAQGMQLEPGLVEVITVASASSGERHSHLAAHINQIAIRTWAGEPDEPTTQIGGVDWILAEDWLPYQRDTFVTPAFAGYVSGHSCFSRAAAEVLTFLTGSPYWPGGLGSHTIRQGTLDFEFGPNNDVTLQWATYYDAADQAGLSRLYGGIHVPVDDGPGRVMGSQIGQAATIKAFSYFDGTVLRNPPEITMASLSSNDMLQVSCTTIPCYHYKFQAAPTLDFLAPIDLSPFTQAAGYGEQSVDFAPGGSLRFIRVQRNDP